MGIPDVQSVSSSVASMKKWGIPQQQTPEIALLERLVWVKYKSKWWPALLYHSYSELQQHLYDQLDMVLKAQFAMAIMKQLQERREVKVARLLGRAILEVVEVEEGTYCEFYWQLPNILPRACRKSHYGGDMEMYFDFHRALDQVEDIIREVSQENFALIPDSDNTTWLERAQLAVKENIDDASSFHGSNASRRRQQNHIKAAHSVLSKATSSIASEHSRTGDFGSIEPPTSPGSNSVSNNSSRRGMRTIVEPSPSNLSKSKSRDLCADSVDAKSRRSSRTKASAVTEVMDNRTGSAFASQIRSAAEEESRDPPSSNNNSSSSYHHSGYADLHDELQDTDRSTSSTPFQILPGLEADDIVPGITAKVNGARSSWRNVLGYMSGSRDERNATTEQPPSHGRYTGGRIGISRETMPRVQNKEMRSLVVGTSSPSKHQKETSDSPADEQQQEPVELSFWQRLTCYSHDF